MTTPNFYRAIQEVVQHAQEQGLAPAITVNHHTRTPVVWQDARTLARDIASYGPLGRWMTAGVLLISAGVTLSFNLNPPPAVQAAKTSQPFLAPAVQAPRAGGPAIVTVNDTRLVPVRFQGKRIHSVHPEDRISLAKYAAEAEDLDLVIGKESWRVVYGMIAAESNWIPRSGMGNNKKASYGIAQIEAATADALGLDPHDPKHAAIGVASLIKEGAQVYRKRRLHGLQIRDDDGRPMRSNDALSVYISVHYNTSTRFRSGWDGQTSSLLTPTKHHIKNVRYGIGEAALIEKQVKAKQAYDDILRHAGTPVLDQEIASVKL